MHFGENQLSPRSISISPLSTTHPPVLQHWWVRASTAGQGRFTLVMDSSRGFGSHGRYCCRLFQTRFPCGSPPLAEVNLDATVMHSPDHSTKGTPSALEWLLPQWPLAAGEYVVSGSVSFPSRGAFHLSLTVLVRYRLLKVFSLGGWSPQLPTRFHVPRGTQDSNRCVIHGSLLDYHHLGWRFPAPSSSYVTRAVGPTTPPYLTMEWFGLLPVRSPLLRESRLISSRRVTEMFQFTRCLPPRL